MPVANLIQAEELRAKLTAVGSAITTPAAAYADGTDISIAAYQFLEALYQAQQDQNAVADTGEDVSIITKGQGAETRIEYPAGSGTFYNVRPTVYSVTLNAVQTVSSVLPVLV